MQTVCTDENVRNDSRRTNIVGAIIYAGGIGRCLKGECAGRLGRKIIGIWKHRRIFGGHQERIWRRGQRISKSSQTKEVRIGGKNNGGVCAGVLEDSKRKQV